MESGKTLLQWYSKTNSCDYDSANTHVARMKSVRVLRTKKNYDGNKSMIDIQFPERVENIPSGTYTSDDFIDWSYASVETVDGVLKYSRFWTLAAIVPGTETYVR